MSGREWGQEERNLKEAEVIPGSSTVDREDHFGPNRPPPHRDSFTRRVMRGLAALEGVENGAAVTAFRLLGTLGDVLAAGPLRRAVLRLKGKKIWPVVAGAYVVENPSAPVAVCTLTSDALIQRFSGLPGIAIVGRVYTPNLGLEKIILNVTTNPEIRWLLLCGRESPIFQPGQAIQALFSNGIAANQRIIGATGRFPLLRNVTAGRVESFRRQVEFVDCMGETDVDVLTAKIRTLVARIPAPLDEQRNDGQLERHDNLPKAGQGDEGFTLIRPGGRREPLVYDPKGFFVITLDRSAQGIVVRHYLPGHSPGFLMRGRSAEGMLLGLLRAELVSQRSHAGYLGAELAKAEAALRLNLRYEQDQPLRRM